jgi:hypothetical protein
VLLARPHAGAGIHERSGRDDGAGGRGGDRRARTDRQPRQEQRSRGRGLAGVRAQGRHRRRAPFLAAPPAVQEVGLRMLPSTDPSFPTSSSVSSVSLQKFRCFNFAGAACSWFSASSDRNAEACKHGPSPHGHGAVEQRCDQAPAAISPRSPKVANY